MSLKLRLSVLRKNLPNLDPKAVGESQRTLTDAMEAVRLLGAIKIGDTPGCWCQVGIGNPMMKTHSQNCVDICFLMADP